jgi:hypothetical protein
MIAMVLLMAPYSEKVLCKAITLHNRLTSLACSFSTATACSKFSLVNCRSSNSSAFQQIDGTQINYHHYFLNELRVPKADISNSKEFLFPLSFIVDFLLFSYFVCISIFIHSTLQTTLERTLQKDITL